MKQKMKQWLGALLSIALILGLMPGMSLTAYADDDPPYAQYKNTTTVIKFDEKDWYLINYDTSTVTLLAKECVGASPYNSSGSYVEYASSTVKTAVDKCHSAGVRVIMVTGDNIITATAIAKDCNIFPEKIDLDNLRDKDVEKNPSEINDPDKKA